ncbi:MAG: hypothetical protein RIT28_2865 [Pseudomonadota bacterium]
MSDAASRTLELLESLHSRLDQLDGRLARLEARLEPALVISEQAESAVAIAVDSLDGLAARAQETGIGPDERIKALTVAAEVLSRPALIQLLERVADRADALGAAVGLAEAAPLALAGVTDTIDQAMIRLIDQGLDVDERLRSMVRAAEVLTRPELLNLATALAERSGDASRAVHTLLDAGVLDEPAVSVIGFAAEALAQSHAHPAEPAGVFTLLQALRDPDVSRAVAFGLAFARRFGARLATSHSTV